MRIEQRREAPNGPRTLYSFRLSTDERRMLADCAKVADMATGPWLRLQIREAARRLGVEVAPERIDHGEG